MAMWSDRFRNEAEADTPQVSAYGLAFKRMHKSGYPTYLPNAHAGVHPTNGIVSGFLGSFPQYTTMIAPIVPQSFFAGDFPLSLQPEIDKPYPWQSPTIQEK